jgi:hypothetical protein
MEQMYLLDMHAFQVQVLHGGELVTLVGNGLKLPPSSHHSPLVLLAPPHGGLEPGMHAYLINTSAPYRGIPFSVNVIFAVKPQLVPSPSHTPQLSISIQLLALSQLNKIKDNIISNVFFIVTP